MKTLSIVSALLMIGLWAGCTSETAVAPDTSGDLSLLAIPTENAASHSSSNVYVIADLPALNSAGTSNLIRTKAGVSFNVQTSGLTAGYAYTLWMIVFNNPDACTGLCDGSDLGNPAVNGDVLHSTGSLAGGTGKATFAGSRLEGDNSRSLFGPNAPGIIDVNTAEIHFVVRCHGEKIPGLIHEQIGTFNGGCPPNNCVDVQFSRHEV